MVFSRPLKGSELFGLPAQPKLSQEGYALILNYEVGGGRNYYERYLARPSWPGGSSGVTIGIGYDLGYNSKQVIAMDWRSLSERKYLLQVAGVKGVEARGALLAIKDICVPWELSEKIFDEVTLARYYRLTARTFPGFEKLHVNAQAALVSLVFNRGSSLKGPRRVEMRAIGDLVAKRNYKAIAAQLRAMKRLWKGKAMEGLLRRREAEARLVEACVSR